MNIVPYEKENTQLLKYQNGEIKPEALKYARRFQEVCYTKFKNIHSENHLFQLFLDTFNPHRQDNKETQLKNIDEMIDAVNIFDDILVALASQKGLNLCKVYLKLEKSIAEPTIVKQKKYLMWDF